MSEIDEHVRRRDDQDDALDHRVIPPQDRLDDQPADARQGEDRLRDHRAGGQADEGEADDRDDGDQGIAEDVLHRHRQLGRPLDRAVVT